MWTLEAALDDYLHVIVRTRPWIKKREEELLTGLSEWLQAQPQARVELDAITPEVVAAYAEAEELDPLARADLAAALRNLYVWAEHERVVDANPFATAAVA